MKKILVLIVIIVIPIVLGISQYEKIININNASKAEKKSNEFKNRADSGDASAMHSIAYTYYISRDGVDKDLQKAFEYYKKAAELGLAKSQNQIGAMYENGEGVERDLDEAVFWYKKASEQNFAIAQLNLGKFYQRQKEIKQAFHWYKKAAENGNPEGQSRLGEMYEYEEGIEKNLDEAFRWYKKAAENEDASAQHNLGRQYFNRGEYEKAIKWFKKAGRGGIPQSYQAIGKMIKEGKGTEKDLLRAAQMYKRARDNGYTKAGQYLKNLDKYCSSLKNPSENDVEACLLAAGAGFPKSQNKLVEFYVKGTGVPKDAFEAYAWLYTYTRHDSELFEMLKIDNELPKILEDLSKDEQKIAHEKAVKYNKLFGSNTQ